MLPQQLDIINGKCEGLIEVANGQHLLDSLLTHKEYIAMCKSMCSVISNNWYPPTLDPRLVLNDKLFDSSFLNSSFNS